jgi:DNA-binding LacI/PurR family transcriptional regulator
MQEAICIAHAAERRGRRVPEQLEVVAFSERHVRGNTGLPISTLAIPFPDVGRRAVEMLQKIIDEGDPDVPSTAVPYGNISI